MNGQEIFECADHREFLQRYLAARKSTQGLRALARRAGFRSPGHLTMLIKGERRLTARSADLLARALDLKGRRRKLLFAFAQLDASQSEKEKSRAREEILRLKSYRPEHKLNAKQYSFLATWYQPALYALLENAPNGLTNEEIARGMGRGVTAAAIERALSDLSAIGLVAVKDGQWRPVNNAISTPDEVRDLAVAKYHRNMIELSEEALDLPLDAREFNGLTVTVPPRLMPQVKEKIRRFREELNEMLSRETDHADVYQLNLHLFPLTKGFSRRDQ